MSLKKVASSQRPRMSIELQTGSLSMDYRRIPTPPTWRTVSDSLCSGINRFNARYVGLTHLREDSALTDCFPRLEGGTPRIGNRAPVLH